MKVISVEKKEKSSVELTIQVEADVFEAAVQQAYLQARKQINVPGFRKGKAPRKVIEGMYGTGVFYEDAINAVYPAAYEAAVQEQGLDAVGYPTIEVESVGKEGVIFKALVGVYPEVKLGEYKGLVAPKEEVNVTEADIDNEMKPLVDRATSLVSVEREAQNGDTTIIDFEGFDNGTPFEGGKGENYELKLGSGSFVPGFEEQIVGMKIGEEKDINITFPENYVPELAGKAVIFHVKLNEVKEAKLPVLDDEFAKDVSEFETLAELREDMKKKITERRQGDADVKFENAVLQKLVENMECEVPDSMVEFQMDRLMEDFNARMQAQGMKLEDYVKMMGMTMEAMRESSRPTALAQVQTQVALTAVAEAEKLEIGEEELDAEFARLSEMYGMPVEQIKAALPVEDMKKDLQLKKASALVLENAKVGQPEEPKAE